MSEFVQTPDDGIAWCKKWMARYAALSDEARKDGRDADRHYYNGKMAGMLAALEKFRDMRGGKEPE